VRRTSEDTDQETIKKTKEDLTCPLCRSPLIGKAIDAGKCQCCGHRFDPKDMEKPARRQV
jgi:rubredoxin